MQLPQLDVEAAGAPTPMESAQGEDFLAELLKGGAARASAPPVARRDGLSVVSELRQQPAHGA
jgi:hypothetical protein